MTVVINSALKRESRSIERIGSVFQNFKIGRSTNTNGSKISCDFESTNFHININYLKSLDPKEWKNQDHYAVLGLEKLRFNATDGDVRRAYRWCVLQHHPDKRTKAEHTMDDDDYFTCITKAYEILGTPKTRRSYDSVDPEFDNALPSQSEIENDFYGSFNKYFNLNSRWSEKKNCPSFGDENSRREDVEKFYSFWYDFKSWREFSYLDEEDKEKGQDRDERRWIEKENKAARIKRKKEEMLRIRSLVDLAYSNDKRIQKFKNEDKEKKLAIKRAKMDAAHAAKAEAELASKNALLAKEKAERAEKKRMEQLRIEKEQTKKALKKERKILRQKAKDNNYFSSNDKEMLKNMEGIEKICEVFDLNELQNLNKEMEKLNVDTFLNALEKANKKLEMESSNINKIQKSNNKTDIINKVNVWNNETVKLLIKAVNLFPVGTVQRWDVVANFLNQHSSFEYIFTAKDVLQKVRALQSSDFSKNSIKAEISDDFALNPNEKREIVITTRENASTNGNDVEDSFKQLNIPKQSKIWTKEEQALLEQAIKSFPITTPDRWDRIAECIPNRTKKDCLRRVKELVDLVNSKKEAQYGTTDRK